MTSFRELLIAMDVSQVDSYLMTKGWARLRPVGTDVQKYRTNFQETDCDVILLTDRNRDQFMDRLFKLVFNVSCVEDREPFEVARDILEEERQSLQSAAANLCIRTILLEELACDECVLAAEQVERLVEELKPAIARAEFVASGFGGPEMFDQATRMKTAIVMVPAARQLAVLCDADIGAIMVHRIVGRILQFEISATDDVVNQLFETLCNDDEAAPMDSLQMLKEIGIR